MDLSTSINILSFLIIVLISVVVSKKARRLVNKILNSIFKVAKFIFISIGFLIILGLIIGLIIWLVNWGWGKFRQKYPGITPIDILGTGLFIIFCFIIWIIWNYLDKKFKISTNKRLNKIVGREAFILVGSWVLGGFIACSFPTMVGYRFGMGIIFFSYPTYILVKFIIWKIKKPKEKK